MVVFWQAEADSRQKNSCPNNLENRFPSTLASSYNISKDRGLNPLDAIWDTEKLREAILACCRVIFDVFL